MEKSEEIRRVIERWTTATARGGDDPLARLSEHPGTLMIGTDPAEWWRGSAAHVIWARQISEVGPFPVRATEIDAWEEGTVGWAAVKESIDWEGQTLESRATYVLHLERDEWKLVQVHWSFPRANTETLGRALTVSLDELEETVRREQPDLTASRAVDGTVTIVFTDIVDSTVKAAELGDRRWRDLLERHNQSVRAELARFGGREIKTTGDGFCATFDSPTQAVRCALAACKRVASLGIAIRAGVHTGEVEVWGEEIGGLAVHIAARVGAAAGAGEVLVSSTVRDVVAGTDLTFEDRGEHELKGVPGSRRLSVAHATL
jgi:class 3 adenylate cyclase